MDLSVGGNDCDTFELRQLSVTSNSGKSFSPFCHPSDFELADTEYKHEELQKRLSMEDIRELGNTARKYGGLYGGQQIGQIGFWTNSKPAACLAMPQK